MEEKKILVIDDEQDLCDILLFNLRAAGYQAEAACSAEAALERLGGKGLMTSAPPFDLLLLDVMMPGMSGFELARLLKGDERTASVPIIFLTAKDAEEDMLHGFGLGADDYVSKPFSLREVLARVKAVLNRSIQQPADMAGLCYETLRLNPEGKTVTIDDKVTPLTRTEYELLCLLMEHRGRVFSRQQLIGQVWPRDVIVTERTVDVNITRLRKKLGRYAACLASRTGFGYVFEMRNEEPINTARQDE